MSAFVDAFAPNAHTACFESCKTIPNKHKSNMATLHSDCSQTTCSREDVTLVRNSNRWERAPNWPYLTSGPLLNWNKCKIAIIHAIIIASCYPWTQTLNIIWQAIQVKMMVFVYQHN